MDFGKIKNNKALQIIAIIAVPTAIVGAYFGYKYINKKIEEIKKRAFNDKMLKQYEKINNVDEFLEGIKYIEHRSTFGYKFDELAKKKTELEAMPFDKLKRLYELMRIPSEKLTPKEQEEFLDLIHIIYP